MTASVRQVNCTSCGAGLDVLGGGRVRVHVCSYCGAQLDVQDDYKVLAQFRDMQRPPSPFSLGMTGTLWGVEFTIIGTIGWREDHQGRTWRWVDHQLFSPTHGYAWMSVEPSGHVTYTRKTRDQPNPMSIGSLRIETSESRPIARMGGRTYKYYASGHAKPFFIEGEFNYVPSMNDLEAYAELVGGDRMMAYRQSGGEIEVETTALPSRVEVFKSFGVPKEEWFSASGVHPLEPFESSALRIFARNLYLATAGIALFLALMFMSFGSDVAATGNERIDQPVSLDFTVTAQRGLTEVSIITDSVNSWAWFEAELLDSEGEAVAGFERGVEYYEGVQSGERWREGSQIARTRVALPPGDYTITLTKLEDGTWSNGQPPRIVRLAIREGLANTFWLFAMAGVMALLGGVFLAQRAIHEMKRWSGSDWSDD